LPAIANFIAYTLQGQHDIFASIAEARIDGWRHRCASR
jgi:hypothetical protein